MIKIGSRWVGVEHPPLIIAEMSGNHNQSLNRALELVDAAVLSGAHAIKLQTATADGLTLDVDSKDFIISDVNSLWCGKKLHALYQESVMPWEWHEAIFKHCERRGIIAFSSPFEIGAVDFLENLNTPCYKIASFELVDLELIKRVAKTGKPIIISTGMASVGEIELAVNTVRAEGNEDIILLKCTSTYPATALDSNLKTISHLRDAFGTEVGLSDHTMGVGVPCAAVAFGATVIEKHFTISRSDGGVDAAFSLEPAELKLLVEETLRSWQAVGSVKYGGTQNEQSSLQFRRSIYISRDMVEGDVLDIENMRVIRPGYGLDPRYFEILVGRRINQPLQKGTPMSWDFIG